VNFCSACGQRRSGALPFCTSCGAPFPDAPGGEAPPGDPLPEPPPEPAGGWDPSAEPSGGWDRSAEPSGGWDRSAEPSGGWDPSTEPSGGWDPYGDPSAGAPAYPEAPPYPPAGDQPDTLLYDRLGRVDAPAEPGGARDQSGWGAGGQQDLGAAGQSGWGAGGQQGWGAGGQSGWETRDQPGWGASDRRSGGAQAAEPFGEILEPSYGERGRAPGYSGAGPPRPPGGRRRTILVAVLAAVVVLAAAGGVAAWLAGRHTTGHSTLPPPTGSRSAGRSAGATSSAASGTERAELAGVTAQIQQSVAARHAVVAATGAVGGCTMSPATGIGQMDQAIGQRQAVERRLGSLQVGAIPGGQTMIADFQQVLKHSIMADQGFVGWMRDIQNAGKCPVPTRTDAPYQAALRQSALAVAAKKTFLKLWNPLAGRFGQPAFTASQL